MKQLPDKLYYSISEVAKHVGVKPHVLRYWEGEFPSLKPKKNRAGNRSYRAKDIEEIMAIKKLLYEDGFKIDGAKKLLRGANESAAEQLELIHAQEVEAERPKRVAELRRELKDLLEFVREL